MRSDSNACQAMLHAGERHPIPKAVVNITFDCKWEEQIDTVSHSTNNELLKWKVRLLFIPESYLAK